MDTAEPICPPSPLRRRGVVAVIVRDQRFLVIRRAASVVAPGKYCFPGGAIEQGESPAQAVVRELREELGIEIVPQRCLWESTTPWQVELAWWAATMAPDAVCRPNPAEVASYAWLSPGEMDALPDLLESNRHFLAALSNGTIELCPPIA